MISDVMKFKKKTKRNFQGNRIRFIDNPLDNVTLFILMF